MIARKNTLNNMILDRIRRSQTYQAIITDLAIEGAIPRNVAEALLCYEIPEYLKTPSGKTISGKVEKATKKVEATPEVAVEEEVVSEEE